jgi:hypothetical protein
MNLVVFGRDTYLLTRSHSKHHYEGEVTVEEEVRGGGKEERRK